VGEHLRGAYTVPSLSPIGKGWVTSDPLGVGLLYWAETDEVIVVATRAGLAAHLVARPGHAPRRDVEGVAWLAYAGNIVGDRTGYEAVRTMPPGSYLDLSRPEAPRVHVWSAMPWLAPTETDLRAAVDAVRADLTASLRALSAMPAEVRVAELTGGRDSRLILALLLAEGLADRYVFKTWGSPTLPDVLVATSLAERFGLDHRGALDIPDTRTGGPVHRGPAMTFDERLRHHVSLSDGMLSLVSMHAPPAGHSLNLSLSGLCGELLRTNYPPTTALTSMDELRSRVQRGGLGLGGAGLLTPAGKDHYTRQVFEHLAAMQPDGGTVQDSVDGFYVANRLRRWVGTILEADRSNRLVPFCSPLATQAAFAIGVEARHGGVLHFEVMRAVCRDLAMHTFAGSGWPERAFAHLPDADDFRSATSSVSEQRPGTTRRGSPRSKANALTVGEENRAKDVDERIPVLRARMDVGAGHPLFELIDRDRTLRAIDGFADLAPSARRAVYGAVSAAIWLGDSS
jgi:hypothetical protein